MIDRFAELLERRFRIPPEQTDRILRRALVGLAATIFVLIATLIVAFDDVFTGRSNISSLQIGQAAPVDITAPRAVTFTSTVLTDRRRDEARQATPDLYDSPDPRVAGQRLDLARQILDYIENVRQDDFATREQREQDLGHITALNLTDTVIQTILDMNDEEWREIDAEIINVLTLVMRQIITENDIPTVRNQLPLQVSRPFNAQENTVIVSIVGGLLRPNTFVDLQATEDAREEAAAAVGDVQISFARGEMVVPAGTVIDDADYEALEHLGLLTSPDRRLEETVQAWLASIVSMVVIGLYIVRFAPQLVYIQPRLLVLLAGLFLIMLLGVRLFGLTGQIYLYPTAALAMLYVVIAGPEVAVIGSLALALLVGLMADNSLEIATMVAAGGIIGTLTLRRLDRVSSYFFAGVIVGVVNAAVVAIFSISAPVTTNAPDISSKLFSSLLNGGIFVPGTAFASVYIVTLLFNLPTSQKLSELSQPSQPLLQRLLREAPGTYQHSLQVANLSEQAANAIGADSNLVHVAALYHDIGKMLNPAFFVENQQNMGNPHDIINDPYRSADIIIRHVSDGDDMAKQYRLPQRIRDFIREHHGTQQVYVFYKQAVNQAGGDETAVDLTEFTYPGPRPRSRETALLMIADSCESAARAMKPTNKQQIVDLVHNIIETKRVHGQLDESNLTLNDLKAIEKIMVDMLQAVYHPRIDYDEAITRKAVKDASSPKPPRTPPSPTPKVETRTMPAAPKEGETKRTTQSSPSTKPADKEPKAPPTPRAVPEGVADDDDSPLPDVPPLPRAGENRANNRDNGHTEDQSDTKEQSTSDKTGDS